MRTLGNRLRCALTIGLALWLPALASAQATDEVRYYHTDASGSVRVITDAAGQVLARHDYWPFGQEWQPASVSNTRRFAGKERDPETGFDYFGGRYYLGGTGRFTSVDPLLDSNAAQVDPQRWNRYSYARNGPTRYVDPDGRAIETPWDIFNAALGVASLVRNVALGNVGGAVVDAGDLLIDAAAALAPGIPGGAATSIRAARLAENARAGRQFEGAVLDALGATKNIGGVSEIASRVTTIPDFAVGLRYGVTEIKNVRALSLTAQLRAQLSAAETARLPFNLIVGDATRRASRSLLQAITATGGRVFVFDAKSKTFREAIFDHSGQLLR